MRRRGGISLMETVVTVGLLGLILALTGKLIGNYRDAENHAKGIERSIEGSQLTLGRLTHELSQAITIGTPALGGSASEVIFTKIDPTVARYPVPMDPSLPSFDPLTPTTTVRYYRSGDNLMRQSPSGGGRSVVLATGVRGFAVDWVAQYRVEVVLSIQERTRVLRFKGQSFIYLERP